MIDVILYERAQFSIREPSHCSKDIISHIYAFVVPLGKLTRFLIGMTAYRPDMFTSRILGSNM